MLSPLVGSLLCDLIATVATGWAASVDRSIGDDSGGQHREEVCQSALAVVMQ
jgi:hypothetical protein